MREQAWPTLLRTVNFRQLSHGSQEIRRSGVQDNLAVSNNPDCFLIS